MKTIAGSEPLFCSGVPLDYSFKDIRLCAEIEMEEPRHGVKRVPVETAEAEVLSTGSKEVAPIPLGSHSAVAARVLASKTASSHTPRLRCVFRTVTTSVKLNNNKLESIQGLPRSLESAVNDPLSSIQWLDLSFNLLLTLEPELLQFRNLKALYIHGNRIKSLPSVERLRKLGGLLSLTLNGNPIEANRFYRLYAIGALSQIRSLDHTTITQDERHDANAWFKGHLLRLKTRREQAEEARLMMNEV